MVIAFSLTPEQKALQLKFRDFCERNTKGIYAKYSKHPGTMLEKFKSLKYVYEIAVSEGIVKGLIPKEYGGTFSGDNIDLALLIEEFYSCDSSTISTITGTALGLSPIYAGGTEEQKQMVSNYFITGKGSALGSLLSSEPNGSANHFNDDNDLDKGCQTSITEDGDYYIINGEKCWATNSTGWEDTGAEVMSIICYLEDGSKTTKSSRSAVVIALKEDVEAQPGSLEIVEDFSTYGHSAVCGPTIKIKGLRVPKDRLVGKIGQGSSLASHGFTLTGALIGIASVGLMRTAYEKAMNFAKTEYRNGPVPIIEYQSVSDLLAFAKMRIESARLLSWHGLYQFQKTGNPENSLMAKVYGSELCVQVVMDCLKAVGVTGYRSDMGFGELLTDASCMPIFDGGNIGVRLRQIQELFKNPNYSVYDTFDC